MTDLDQIRIAFDEASLTQLKIVLGIILFGIALDTRAADFRTALSRPRAILVGMAAQFLLLPPLVFLLSLALDVRGSIALGMIFVACCPAGNVSNILTHRAGGDVALSVSMTAVGNLITVFALVPNFTLWASLHPKGSELFNDFELDGWSVVLDILVVIGVPFALGMLLAHRWPAAASRASKIVGPFALVALIAIIVIGVAGNWSILVNYLMAVFFIVLAQDILSLGLGYGLARLTGLPPAMRKAMTFEVGIRNSGLGLVIVFAYFEGLGGMALIVAWWGIWDMTAGLILAQLWRRRLHNDGTKSASALESGPMS